MKKITLILSLAFIISSAFSQKVLLDEEVPQEVVKSKWGENLQHFGHLYVSFGFFTGPSEIGAKIKYGSSMLSIIGYRYKYKVSNYYSLGADLSFSFKNYYLKDDDNKILPDNVNHDKEYFTFISPRLEIYQRINIDKRGNKLGKYLDIGAFGSYNVSTKYYTRDKVDNMPYEKINITTIKLKYIEPLSYGITARIGYNEIALFAEYRLSDMMKPYKPSIGSDILYPELPRLAVGLDIVF